MMTPQMVHEPTKPSLVTCRAAWHPWSLVAAALWHPWSLVAAAWHPWSLAAAWRSLHLPLASSAHQRL
eukprot:1085931-Prorocentrum_minimum.AAC.1